MKPRKVHRFGFERNGNYSSNRRARGARTGVRTVTRAACGVFLYPGTPDCGRGIPDAAFANLPAFAQCKTCLYHKPRAKSITPRGYRISLMPDEDVVWEGGVSSMETMFLAFARLCTDMLELRRDPTWRHRCYHRAFNTAGYESLEPCGGCGTVSLLDPAHGERALAVAIGPSDDGYVFRHACATCGISFRTKHPRGAVTRCAFCRGRIEDATTHGETYTSAFAVAG